jgi:methylglutaconyl-CoA hydratase
VGASPHPLETTIEGGVARVRLNRPAKRNAFDEVLSAALRETFHGLTNRADVRVVVLSGNGETFCAGGDLEWMRRAAGWTREENLADAAAFQGAFEAIDRCAKPVVARVHGAALGGGAGLVAVCDVAVAATGTLLGFPEVRLGLVPGVISPYVVRKIGVGHARRLFLTGERFDATVAERLGLVHAVAPVDQLDAEVDGIVAHLMAGAPGGQSGAKDLVRALAALGDPCAPEGLRLAREAIANARASPDGREGTGAFLEKRKPSWAP